MRILALLGCAIVTCVLTGCGGGDDSTPPQPVQGQVQATRSPTPASRTGVVQAETVTSGLERPWGLAFLPDGRMLVTERPGRVRLVGLEGGLSGPLPSVPTVAAGGQGGLHDVALDPQFTENGLVYLCFAEPDENGAAGTAVARGRLDETRLEDMQVIYRQQPKVVGENHFGCRLVFASNGTLFVALGDRFDYRDQAQNLSSALGKIVRIFPDGSVPPDNPFVGRTDARSEIWSYGHRNIQAAAIQPGTQQLWTVEHGALGGDELNHPEARKNYGWPVITYGIDYNEQPIGEGTSKPGMEQPVYYWDPAVAPSGMVFYTGDRYPGWTNSVLTGSLTPGLLVRLALSGGSVVQEERYLAELGERIRDVRQGPDGFLYLLTDNEDGRILRLLPANS